MSMLFFAACTEQRYGHIPKVRVKAGSEAKKNERNEPVNHVTQLPITIKNQIRLSQVLSMTLPGNQTEFPVLRSDKHVAPLQLPPAESTLDQPVLPEQDKLDTPVKTGESDTGQKQIFFILGILLLIAAGVLAIIGMAALGAALGSAGIILIILGIIFWIF